ncbi:hypothetical protein BGX21_010151 [Mortierella sp. AD011]|nr:hypothetical protein BGX20_010437 [Mortierella sp. AD010]KAF9394964.1 hypothetical protein BGX21_010151 [Mortierella sp. AD011]
MSSHQQLTYVEPEILKVIIQDKSKIPGKDYIVIDVRDEDRVGGHIPGSVNIPSKELPDRLPILIEQYQQVPELYFHCALSQARGPKAARRWSNALVEREETGQGAISQNVRVLRGGFGEWQRKYKDDKNLVEAYEAEYWTEDYY